MVFAAATTPVPDDMWLPAALVLIFAAPIGAFLSLYSVLVSFLFRTSREAILVAVLGFLALGVNGSATLLLINSPYNGLRYIIVSIAAFVIAVAAGCVSAYRLWRITLGQRRPFVEPLDDAFSRIPEDR